MSSKTNYIIVVEPKIEKITAYSRTDAEKKFRESRPEVTDVLVVPRSAVKVNSKRIAAF